MKNKKEEERKERIRKSDAFSLKGRGRFYRLSVG
jgi:hypothetical protein